MNTLWFDVAVMALLFAVGNVVFGRFEERTPRWRRLAKMAVVIPAFVWISATFGRRWFWILLGLSALAPLYIHTVWLPRRGINGWTGEPREKYYALRGWKYPPD